VTNQRDAAIEGAILERDFNTLRQRNGRQHSGCEGKQ
jgi:hypothetical protein